MKDFLYISGNIIGLFVIITVFLILPLTYWEGSVRSEYLKEQQGITTPWYKAAMLPDTAYVVAEESE